MTKLVISLVGRPGSGKSTAAQHLQQAYGFSVFTFSAVIREFAAANNITLRKRADYAATSAKIYKKYGRGYMVNRALQLDATRICIDDVRSPRFVDIIRKAGGISVAFDCPTGVRFAHVHNHPDKTKYPPTLEAFIANEREDEAVNLGPGITFAIDDALQAADHHLDASGSLAYTLEQLDAIVKPLLVRS